MTNDEFKLELRREMKFAKKQFLYRGDYPKVYRHWNLYKVQLKALQNLMERFPELSADELNKLINQNPTTLKFLNDCLVIMPNMIDLLRKNDYLYIFENFYVVRREQVAGQRGRKKRVIELEEENNYEK